MITTPNLVAGTVYGTRLRVESGAPMHAWKQQRPVSVAFRVIDAGNQIDNSTGVSARERRPL